MRFLRERLAPVIALGLFACASAPPSTSTPCPTTQNIPPVAAAPAPAALGPKATVSTPEAAVARLFTSKAVEASWLSESFAKAVPIAKVQSIVDEMKEEAGAFKSVEKSSDAYTTVFERGTVPTKCAVDADGRIVSLWFSALVQTHAPPIETSVAEIRSLPGKIGVLVMTDGKDVASHEADARLAVGSAFKLAILDELRQRIEAKRSAWTETAVLKGDLKSLPSGFLQEWPDGAPLTLHTLASLMISQSDNTATDTLLDFVGRTNVEKRAPGNAPFISTREAFILKAKAGAPLLARWRGGDEAARRKLLAEIAKTRASFDHTAEPSALDVEWMFSPRKLCELLSRNKDLSVMQINPGLANKKDWTLVAFKGGSEPGVLNFSTWVEKGGHKHCVVTTWNDATKAVDTSKLARHHSAILAALRDAQ